MASQRGKAGKVEVSVKWHEPRNECSSQVITRAARVLTENNTLQRNTVMSRLQKERFCAGLVLKVSFSSTRLSKSDPVCQPNKMSVWHLLFQSHFLFLYLDRGWFRYQFRNGAADDLSCWECHVVFSRIFITFMNACFPGKYRLRAACVGHQNFQVSHMQRLRLTEYYINSKGAVISIHLFFNTLYAHFNCPFVNSGLGARKEMLINTF